MTHSKILCGSCIKPKEKFKIQIIGILEEKKLLLLTKKCTYEKWTKNLKLSLRLKPADTRSNNN